MKLAVVGSRIDKRFEPELYSKIQMMVYTQLDELNKQYNITEIVSGGARGVDSMARNWALTNNVKLIEFIPDWDKYGKFAGYKRNLLIVNHCDKLVAFWDGQSRGTKHSIDIAASQNKLMNIYRS